MGTSVEIQARRRLATNARSARLKLDLTQERAAELIGTSVQVLQRLERAAAAVTIDLVARIADGYEIDIAELFATTTAAWKQPRRPVHTKVGDNGCSVASRPRLTRRALRLDRTRVTMAARSLGR
jgi:transcriptional regulator with XRE-family HTH domain